MLNRAAERHAVLTAPAIIELIATILRGSANLVKQAQAGAELSAQASCSLSRLLGRAADLASLHASISAQHRTTLRPDEQVRVEGHQRAAADFFSGTDFLR